MKATDFDFRKDLSFDLNTGVTTFLKSTRLALFDVEALGLLRSKVIEAVGLEKAREIYLQFGFQQGYSDFLQMNTNYKFANEMELLASGPVIHTWEGIVKATPTEIRFDRETGDFFFTGIWTNSYEADQHLSYQGHSDEPTCWSLMGYASGWCSAFFGRKLIAVEPICMGKGDSTCGWEIKPEKDWGPEATPYIEALKIF